ncbi:MAG: hypothetical protein PHW51_02480 [Candidatus Omnitrophica bacterium]|nr:hypothetical protein [Candidatus Omnitrophota bacterium]
MKTIRLKPINITGKILLRLEKKGLVRTLKPTAKILRRTAKNGLVDTIYSSPVEHGTHKLICVRPDNGCGIALNSHPHNEEFIVINNTGLKLKPVLMAIALSKHRDIERKAKKGRLTSKDFLLLRLKYNDHKTCVFTMLKDTPHCEMSEPGRGRTSIFFVSEPANLPMSYLDMAGYAFAL